MALVLVLLQAQRLLLQPLFTVFDKTLVFSVSSGSRKLMTRMDFWSNLECSHLFQCLGTRRVSIGYLEDHSDTIYHCWIAYNVNKSV